MFFTMCKYPAFNYIQATETDFIESEILHIWHWENVDFLTYWAKNDNMNVDMVYLIRI